jgi:G protein-coupled receptor 107
MAVLLVFKFLSVFFESVRYHAIGILGHAEFWAFVYYLFTFIKGVFLFTVILLIGAGWSFLKPFLNAAEKRVICLVLTLQVVNNIALVILTNETTGEFGFSKWNAILHLVDILCCCAVLIPIVWQVNSLEKSLVGSGVSNNSNSNEEDAVEKQDNHQQLESYEEEEEEMLDVGGENGRVLAKLKLFRSFYLLVVAYIYTTRILVYLFATMLNYKYLWIRYFVIELVTLCFYVVVGLMFRPMVENPYLSLKKDDDNVNEDDDAEEEGVAMQSRTI